MSKDPAFLFYDGDAARDVSHMNRLERGCYFDLIQAQKKFGSLTIEQIKKIIGKDFDACWPALELILKFENGFYFIEWVNESIEKRKEHSEKQKQRIQKYWDEKNKKTLKNSYSEIPRNNHGNSNELPLENENENENAIKNLKEGMQGEKQKSETKNKKFNPPKLEEVKAYFKENDFPESLAVRFFNSYSVANWHDSQGSPVKNWKQKAINVWFKDENKTPVKWTPPRRNIGE